MTRSQRRCTLFPMTEASVSLPCKHVHTQLFQPFVALLMCGHDVDSTNVSIRGRPHQERSMGVYTADAGFHL